MATPDNGLVAMLYNSCHVNARVGDGTVVTLKEETHYPFDENIKITVAAPNPVNFPLYIRIPKWCNDAGIFINGHKLATANTSATYTRIENLWKDGDVIEINFPMTVHVTTWTQNKNSVSINYGPLTFSLKIKEEYKKEDSKKSAIYDSRWQQSADAGKWPAYEIFPGSSWNYGLLLNESDTSKLFEVVKKQWPADDFPFSQQNVPIWLRTKGKQIPQWQIDQYGLVDTLPQSPVAVNTNVEQLELIPTGAARLRISAFPVVK
jgi:hypothetical protein